MIINYEFHIWVPEILNNSKIFGGGKGVTKGLRVLFVVFDWKGVNENRVSDSCKL